MLLTPSVTARLRRVPAARRRRSIGFSLLLCAVSFAGCLDAPRDERFAVADSIVDAWVRQERIPGAVLLISLEGRVALEKAYGAAKLYDYDDAHGDYGDARGAPERLPTPRPMTTRTVFDLASVTKVMATTMAVMILTDRGAVDVDEPVRTYLPDFRGGGRESITLRHLLTHRSGLAQWHPVYYHASDPDQAYAYIRRLPLEWPPGSERRYSDLGFMVLGRVVEQVSGRTLADFLREELYEPLGLSQTGFRSGTPAASASPPFAATSHGNPFERRMVHDEDFGYRVDVDPDAWDGWRRYTLEGEVNDGNAFHAFGGVAGHAGLFSTAVELDVLLRLLIDRGRGGGRRLIAPEVVDEFLSPTGEGQALGWQIPSYAPPGSFVHSGFTGTYALGIPDRGLGLVLLTNRQNLGVDSETSYPDVGPLQRAVAAAVAVCC